MPSFFSSHKYAKIPTNELTDSQYDVKMGYQYTNAQFATNTRSNRSDSSGSYSSVASSDSAYEKLAPSEEELSFYDDDKALQASSSGRRVRFELEKSLPALSIDGVLTIMDRPREAASGRKPRRMSSRDGAYAWFSQRRYQNADESLENSMEKRTF